MFLKILNNVSVNPQDIFKWPRKYFRIRCQTFHSILPAPADLPNYFRSELF